MKCSELAGKIRVGDRVGIKSWIKEKYFDVDKWGNILFDRMLMPECFSSDEWQIIPAEPVVFKNASECLDFWYKDDESDVFSKEDMVVFGNTMNQNGRNELFNELMEVLNTHVVIATKETILAYLKPLTQI